MSRSKHKKLYYVPGLVSLILVPLLFAYFGNKEIQKLDVRGLEVNSWHPDYTEYWGFPERNYKQIILTGNTTEDKAAIEDANFLIKVLYTSKDTLIGIQFTFTDSASYSSYVGILNYFKKENINYFVPYKNNIWVVYSPPPKLQEGMQLESPCLLCDDVIVMPPDAKHLNILEQIHSTILAYSSGIKKLWPIIALLSILVIVTITQIIRRVKPPIV